MSDYPAPTQSSGPGGAVTAAPPVALRGALVDAIRRRRRRIRSRAAVAGGVCAAVGAAVLVGGLFTGGPERVLAIDEGNDWVRVQILDGDAGAAEMTRELQDAGIDAQVRALPAFPESVGHWMGITLGREAPPRSCDPPPEASDRTDCANPPLLAGDDVRFGQDSFQIRRDAIPRLGETTAILYVGREPAPAEKPVGSPPSGFDLGFVYPQAVQPDSGAARAR